MSSAELAMGSARVPLSVLRNSQSRARNGRLVRNRGPQSRARNEGSLSLACATGNYKYINIAFLVNSGTGCASKMRSQIQACKNRGVKVLLSLGGATGMGRR
ncbi:hypothetical protein ZOSMA_265G00150 [Zostera marina]|uniref:GH18 domain-containing protein n=1 Tax=Zostera marina TaxID=29655 RepID=A0A0K9PEW8_ZOSMR|nr:hypothetical protein ZOSMA_265G00150 [Zostera marina]